MFAIFKSPESTDLELRLQEMLGDCARMFSLATSAIIGDVEAESVREELWDLDKGINRSERAVRRELLVRGAVRGAEMEHGLSLAYMSVGKDVERIGDYCKNIWDLAHAGVSFGGASDLDVLRQQTDEVAELLSEGREAFSTQDVKRVHSLIPRMEVNAVGHDDAMMGYIGSSAPASEAVPRALYYRFLKRIVSHMENVLTSVVMPLDRIDFYKESKATDAD